MLAIVTRTQAQAKSLQLRLLASCAMATSMISAGTAQAVTPTPPPLTGADTSFQGIGTVTSGNATIVQTPTLDTITVSNPRTVIDFTPFDTANGGGPITFLPAGRTGLFQNDPNSGVTNFTVLNRIIPTDATRAIRFDGTVQSRIANATGGSAPGGTILFYSPGGIIASATSVFDVGSLVLSAADINFGESSNSFSFSGATPGTAVDINNGASILAQGAGSYVALVAPRIIQSGTVKSDGSVGYIAAEAVNVTIQNNLFSISFVTGTNSGAAVTHTGTTELTRAPNDATPQRIYVAAVPKNDAITTLVSGSLGYSAATQASVRDGAVILSAGRNVSESGYGGTNFTDFAASTAPANITIGADAATIFSASLLTDATGNALIAPAAGTTIEFNGKVALNADRLAEVRAVANSSAIFDSGLSVTSNNLRSGAAARVIALGEAGYGNTGYGSTAGVVNVGGTLLINGGPSLQTGKVQTSVAELIADRGRISVSGPTRVIAADDATENGTLNAFGGNALVRAGASGSQLSLGNVVVSAGAVANTRFDENEMRIDGNATGGSARIEAAGGNFIAGNITVDSDAVGRPAGIATGGSTSLAASGGTASFGTVSLSAKAAIANNREMPPSATAQAFTQNQNAAANSGGSQTLTGGTIQLDVINTTININGDLTLNTEASGSESLGGLQGGTIGINVDNGNLRVGDVISASASAEETASLEGVPPGTVRGGTITALVSNDGDILASAMNYSANAASGGDTLGGSVSLTTNSGGSIRSTGAIALGAAAMVRDVEAAGDAMGGTLVVNINSGSVESGPLILDASALGGDAASGSIGGTAAGGSARVNIVGGDSTIERFSLTTDAKGGRGGNGNEGIGAGGNGGSATAGTSEINITGGALRTAGLVMTSSATGGDGGDGIMSGVGGAGGLATGGRAAVLTSETTTLLLMKLPTNPQPTALASSIDSSARGGFGGSAQSMAGGAGGMAAGGTSILTLASADILPETPRFVVDLTVNSEGAGGRGGASNNANGGNGGSAIGGAATLNLINNRIDFGRVALSTRGSGGSGGSAGNAGYGTLPVGGTGGNGSGGASNVTIAAPAASIVATNIANLAITAEAVGGSGGTGSKGGNGGNAINTGSASFNHSSGIVAIPVAILTANSFGGRGGIGFSGDGGNGGSSFGGTARITADGATTNLTVNVTGVVATAQSGIGGDAQPGQRVGNGGNAGTATGGTAEIIAKNGSTTTLAVTAIANARSFGEVGGSSINGSGGAGGAAIGGTARIDGSGAKLIALDLTAVSGGFGGAGGNAGYGSSGSGGAGGLATGGLSAIIKTAFNDQNSTGFVGAFAVGGAGGSTSNGNGGDGGAATGGTAQFDSKGITANTLTVTAGVIGGAGGNAGYGGNGGAGGDGTGGTATVTNTNFNVQSAAAFIGTNAGGGSGGAGRIGGNGGAAIAGTSSLVATNGTNLIGTVDVSASTAGGMGGAQVIGSTGGRGGNGGIGQGGTTQITIAGGTFNASNAILRSEAGGGAGGFGETGGNGGLAMGGTAMLSSGSGAATQIGSLSVRVGAGGGTGGQASVLGGNGGNAQGGTSTVSISGGTFQASNVMIRSAASGGVSNLNSNGGSALGGTAQLTAANSSTLSVGNLVITADAFSNNFVTSSNNQNVENVVTPRTNGNAVGGIAALNVSSGSTLSGTTANISANATVMGQEGDVLAGDATGGTTSVNVNNATVLLTQALNLSANANAMLGVGQGGTVNVLATGATLSTPSTTATATGRSFVAGTEIGGRGGIIDIRAEKAANSTAGVLNLGNTNLEASGVSMLVGNPEAMTNAAAGRINIAAIGGQTTATNFATLSALTLGRNSGGFNPNAGIFLSVDKGAILANSAVTLLSDESIAVSAIGTGNIFVGNDLSVEALNTITVSHSDRSPNANTIFTAKADFIAGNDFNAMPGSSIRSDNDLTITSNLGGVSAHDLVAGDDIAVTANGLVNITGLAQTTGITAGSGASDIVIDAGAGVTIANANAKSSLIARGTSITGTNLIAGEDIALRSPGDIIVTSGMAGDDIDVTTTGGSIALGNVTTSGLGADNRRASLDSEIIGFGAETFARSNILANAVTGISVTSANARDTLGLRTDGNISATTLVAGEDATFASSGNTTITTVTAGDDIDLNAAGTVTVLGATSTGNGADDRRVFLPVGSAFFTGENLTRSNIIAFSATAVTLGSPPTAMMPQISAAASLAIRSNGTITASNIAAGEDIALSANGNISVTAALAGDDFSALSTSGDITLTGITTNTSGADDRAVNFGYGAIGFATSAANGSDIDATAGYGSINLGTLNAASDLSASARIIDKLSSAALVAGQDIILSGQTSVSVGDATAGRDFMISSNGTASVVNVTAGDDIIINALGAVSATGSLLTSGLGASGSNSDIEITTPAAFTFNAISAFNNFRFSSGSLAGSSIVAGNTIAITADSASSNALRTNTGNIAINARVVSLGTTNAGLDLIIDTQGAVNSSIMLGTAIATRDISLTAGAMSGMPNPSAMASISATSLTAGDDIDIFATNSVNIGSALTNGNFNSGYGSDLSNLTITTSLFGRADLTNGRAKDNLTIMTGIGGANSTESLTADRGNILVNGQMSANIAQATATLGSVTLNAAFVNAANVSAGTDANVNFFVNSTLGAVTAARDITVTGSGQAMLSATSLVAGDDIVVTTGGNATIALARTTGSLNSGYGSDPSNLSVSSQMGAVSLTRGQAKDNLTLTAMTGVTSSASLTADRGAILVNGGTTANLMNATATVGTVTINAGTVSALNVNAGTDIGVNFGNSAMLGSLTAGQDINVTGSGNATIGSASAARDITAMVGGNVAITSANAGRNLRSTSANFAATTLGASTDVVILTDAAANIGTTTAGARIVANAGTSIGFTQLMSGTTTSLVASTSITGGNANAGTTLTLNANGGAVGFGMLSSGANTVITASSAITGNSANAAGALMLNSGANGITAATLTSGSGNNLTVTASNGGNATITTATSGLDLSVNANNVSVATGTAARDALYTAANNIVAGATSAGRNVALSAVGTINANTATAVANILANSTGNVSLVTSTADNIFVTTTGDATLGTANAATMIGVNAKNISAATLTAGEDIRLIASGTANVTTATAGDDFDVSANNGITLGNITSTGTARDDRSVVFNAPAFAIVASPADGSDIRLSSNGAISAANLDAGDDILINSGSFTLTGLAKTRRVGATGSGSDIIINAGAVVVAMANAADNLTVNATTFNGTSLTVGGMINVTTSGNQSLGTANATRGPINGTSTAGTISFVNLTTGGDINLNAGNAIAGGSANAGGSIQLTSGAGITGDMIRSASDILIVSDTINIGNVTSDFSSIFLNGRDITVGTAGAGLDVIVDTRKSVNSRIALGNVTAARDIMLFGASNGLTATSLLAGDDIDIDITGNAKITTARTTGSFNGGYGDVGYGDALPNEGGNGSDLSNITLNAAQAMIGKAQATDNVSLTTITGTMANNVIADRGAVLVNGGTSANIMNATATLGAVTVNAGAVTANNVNAATNVAMNFGASATLGTVVAGDAININGSGNAAFTSLTSSNATTIMAGGSVAGGTSVAGTLLSVMADSIDVDALTSLRSNVVASGRSVDIGSTNAAVDALIDTKGLASSSIVLGSVTAGNDISLTGGTNGITATSLTAADDIDVLGSGKITIANALVTGTRSDMNNIILTAATQAMIGTARAKDNLTVTGTTGVMATALTADRGAVLVNGGPSVNVGGATASQGSVTINGGNITAGTVSANTNANFNFGGMMSVGRVTAGGSINVSGNGPSVIISQRDVIINEAIAGFDVIIDTAGLSNSSIQLGNVTAQRDISLSGATNGLSATGLTAGDDIDVIGAGNVTLGSANANGTFNSGYGEIADPSNITITANMGSATITAGAQAKDNITISTRDGATANSLIADRGNILVNGGTLANIAQSTATLGNVTLNAATITAGTVSAANDATINAGALATINSITAGRDIAINGATNGIDVTTLRAGDDIDIVVTGNARLSTAIAADAVTITGTTASQISSSVVQADRGDVIVTGAGMAGFGAATATLGKVQLTNNRVFAGTIRAGTDVAVTYDAAAMIGSVTAGRAIQVGGTGNLEFDGLQSGGATTLNIGGAVLGRGGPVTTGSNFASTSVGVFTNTGAITAATTANIMASRVNTANVTGGTGVMLRGSDSVTAGAVTATANDAVINAMNGVTLGSANAGNSISISNINNAIGTGALTAGNDITITNGGAVNLASASVADDLRIIGQAGVTIGAVTVRGGMDQDADGNDVFVRTAGPIAITSATTMPTALANSDIFLTSTASSINGGTLTSRGAVALNAATSVTVGTATSGRNILLTGQSINATTLNAATDIDATSSGAMTLGTASATGGNVSLTAAGALSAMNASATGNTRLTSTNGGNITSGTLSSGTGDIVITSDGNATMTGNSSAGRNLNVTARNLISVGGVANGTAIDLKSTDITVNTTSGRIGEQGRTTVAQLTNTGTGVTTIGGAGVTTGYSLSNAEAQRIFAGDIIITAARTSAPPGGTQASQTLNAAAPDVVLNTLTLTGATGQTGATAGNIGATGRLRIETPGKLRTVGTVAISNLASANRFQVNAAQSIEVDAATGSVSLSGAAGTLGGTLELTAPSVIAASLTAIGAVAAAVDGRTVNDRLAINDNAISDAGAFSANAIIVNVSNGFFVQNSGIKELSAFSFGDRRGITVGSGGLTINAASATTRIFVNGRQLQANGSFITGIDFLRAQTINGTRIQLSTFPPTPFDAASTVNGCAIITASTCLVTIDGGSLARDVVGQSDDDSGGSSENSGSGSNDFVRFEFKSLDTSTFAPVIDDPVTGVGNDDLYALYDARDCTDDQNLESCAKAEAKPQ